MATPSSSATSESPPLVYLHPNTMTNTNTDSMGITPNEREQEKKKAVQKFLARAEISMITRGLRARLSYASYKATHNIPQLSLRDLETKTQNQTTSFPRTTSAKRKVGGGNNYYNNPATQGGVAGPAGSASRRGVMAPPPVSASASRAHQTSTNGGSNRSANSAPSLYSSILSPPPTKQARTVHNPGYPPVSASSHSTGTPRSRRDSRASDTRSVRSIAEGTRAQTKNRRDDKSPDKRKDKRTIKGKQKESFSPAGGGQPGEDVDMKAVATLTSLLLQSRPSISGSASSPRSAHSDAGSNHSYSHFAQSSTRTTTAPTTAVNSAEPSFSIPNARPTTPPPSSRPLLGNITPKLSHPADSEAAGHLLFLASSPSPARPTTSRDKDAKDMAAFRALSGGAGLRATGRVLFPGADASSEPSRALTKAGENSFTLSMSSMTTEITPDGETGTDSTGKMSGPGDGGANSSARMAFSPQQLLPPPPSPSARPASTDPANPWSSSFASTDSKFTPQAPPTPNTAAFNFNDFINVSPSPAAASPRPGHFKSGLSSSLSNDVRRRLFEEHQSVPDSPLKSSGDLGMSPSIGLDKPQGSGLGGGFEEVQERRVGSLGSGIDLVQT